MTTQAFSSEVLAAVEAWRSEAFPQVPAFYENGPLPEESQVGPVWIDVGVRWYGARLVSVGERPRGRHQGTISLQVYAKATSGTARSGEIVDSAVELLRARRLGGGVLAMPQRSLPTEFSGWAKTGLLVPFTLDSA